MEFITPGVVTVFGVPIIVNIIANTIPIAIVFVIYGTKKIVCKNFWNGLIEFNATAIYKASIVETGTVTIVTMIVFCKHCLNCG